MSDAAADPVPLAQPVVGEREEELVLEVLRSGRLSLGPMLERFEAAFADLVGADDAVAVSSGTAALHLGVRRHGWGRGDEVITSPFSFVASANCLLYEDVRPVFCDIDPVTFDLDPDAAAAAVGPATAGVLPIDIFGYPCDMPAFEALAGRHGLGILEDACEALGAVDRHGRQVGSAGVLATFAFYANKQLTTGEGGMIVPRDAAEAALLRSERNQGRAVDMGWLAHERLGFNYRLSDVAAAIGVGQVERAAELLEGRDRVAAAYAGRLGDLEGVELPIADRGAERRSWFVYVVRLPRGIDRDAVIRGLATHGVQSKEYLPCLHLFEHLREPLGHRPGDFPVAEDVAARSLALPFFPAMTEGQVDRVGAALETVLASAPAAA